MIESFEIDAAAGAVHVTASKSAGELRAFARLGNGFNEADLVAAVAATEQSGLHAWDGAALLAVPDRPSAQHEWDWATMAWTMDDAAAWSLHRAAAKVALDESDITVLRCLENGVAVPDAWLQFRADLRVIVRSATGDASQPLPSRPAYPSGT